jgi:hypothetical protein
VTAIERRTLSRAPGVRGCGADRVGRRCVFYRPLFGRPRSWANDTRRGFLPPAYAFPKRCGCREVLRRAHAEYVMLAELHDVPVFSDVRERLNSVGLLTVDDMAKES